MDRLAWVVIISAIAIILNRRNTSSGWHLGWGSFSHSGQASGSWKSKVRFRQISDSLYEQEDPAEPPQTPRTVVLFFHGFHSNNSKDVHLETWESHDGSCIWPNEWLVQKFRGARILYVSYGAILGVGEQQQRNLDLHNTAENLALDFIQAGIGQTLNCPLILVGHCFGGLVIKQLCLHMSKQNTLTKNEMDREKFGNFLRRTKGVFYYGTPHRGSQSIGKAAAHLHADRLLQYFQILNLEASRLNLDFSHLCCIHPDWRIRGLGESLPTNQGIFQGGIVASEASSRDGEQFNVVPADHISISKPQSEIDMRFYALASLLDDIVSNMEVEVLGHQCHSLPDYPMQLKKRAQAVEEILKNNAILGIFGMGGIGKTTIAKKVYNKISKDFEYTCFLDNVKGQSDLDGWARGQFYRSGKSAEKMQWKDLKEKRALIVLDDVDAEKQLDVFPKMHDMGSGSRIIITSRDKEILGFYKKYGLYEVDFLRPNEAKTLFCQHAFGLDDIPELTVETNHLEHNVPMVVEKCGGLPLTLEVMGKYLCDHATKSNIWEETIHKLGEARSITGGRNDRVWASLKVSYDALAEEEQKMFLEAGTFFFGQPLNQVLAAWSTAIGEPETRWGNLLNRAMVRENGVRDGLYVYRLEKTVWVHEQLRDLAKSLLGEGIMKQGLRGEGDILLTVLNSNQMKEEATALRLSETSTKLQLDPFVKLKNIKYLDLNEIQHEGSGKNFPRKLSLLAWHQSVQLESEESEGEASEECESEESEERSRRVFPISLDEMNNLAVLKLKGWEICEGFSEALGKLTNLRILSLDHLIGLDSLPENFGNLPKLKELGLFDLSLPKLPKSLGNLSDLKELTLYGVECLELPKSVGNLSKLETIRIENCEKLASLPASFGRSSKSLKYLRINECPLLECLPQSFSQLWGLQELHIYNCYGLKEVGDSFGSNLKSLKYLSFGNCPLLDCLPESFSQLCGLQQLYIDNCQRLNLGDSFGSNLESLKCLGIWSCDVLECLPQSFSRLRKLEDLVIYKCCALKELGDSFASLSALRSLTIIFTSIERLPADFGLLPALEELTLEDAPRLTRLPDNIGKLTNLRKLQLARLPGVNSLPDTFDNLTQLKDLSIRSLSLFRLPESIGKLSALEKLELSELRCSELPESIGDLSSLGTLNIANCDATLPASFGQGLKSLTHMCIWGCPGLEHLPQSFSKLPGLQKLRIESCYQLKELGDSFGKLSTLRHLTLNCCNSTERLPDNFGLLSALEELQLWGADELTGLPESIGQLKALKILRVQAPNLKTLPESLGLLNSLQELTIECDKLERLPESLGELAELKDLSLTVDSVTALPDNLGKLSSVLETLTIAAGSLQSLPNNFGQLSSVRKLKMFCNCLEKLPDSLGDLSSLEHLAISSKSLKNLPETVGRLQSVRVFSLCAKSMMSVSESIGQLSSLEEFVLDGDGLERLPDGLHNLPLSSVALTLSGGFHTRIPKGLGNLSALGDLTLQEFEFESLSEEIGNLSSLRRLQISSCSELTRLPESLGCMSSMREMELLHCRELRTLPDSLGRPFSSQVTPPQEEHRNEGMEEKPSSQRSATKGLRLGISACENLDESRMRSLGWVMEDEDGKRKWYRRQI